MTTTYRGLYINKFDGTYAEYGYTNCDITDENNWDKVLSSIPEEAKEQNKLILKSFKNEYTFAGNPPVDLVMQNLKYIREHLDPKTQLILVLDSEKPTDKYLEGYEGMAERHIIMNKYVREFAKKYDGIGHLRRQGAWWSGIGGRLLWNVGSAGAQFGQIFVVWRMKSGDFGA